MNLKRINLIVLAAVIGSFLVGTVCLADPSVPIMRGFTNAGTAAGYPVNPGSGVPTVLFANVWVRYINGMLTLMGALFMIMIIYAGYLWMMAQGKEDQVARAKRMIINAVIAIGVIIAARIIVELVLFYLGQTIK